MEIGRNNNNKNYTIMSTILRKTFLLSALTVFAIGTAIAQPKSYSIEPASKGDLPALPDRPAAGQDGVLPILEINFVRGSQDLWDGSFEGYELWLKFKPAEEFGGTHYTLESFSENGWKTWTDSDDNPVLIESGNDFVTPPLNIGKCRLVLHGGSKDGWVSNEVSSPYMRLSDCYLTGMVMNYHVFATLAGDHLPGIDVYVTRLHYSEAEPQKEFGPDCPYYKYSWYRRNPNTGEMTLIKDATEKGYTPTIEDVGYELIEVVTGDDQNLSLYQTNNFGIVRFPVEASINYLDRKGFVLNTAYILPNGGKDLRISELAGSPDGGALAFPEGSIKEIKPGQYDVSIPIDKYEGHDLRYGDERYFISFVYDMPVYGDDGEFIGEEKTHREAQIMPDRYPAPLMLKALCNDQLVEGVYEVIGKGWDGKLEVVATQTTEQARSESLELPIGQYYVKFRKTDTTLETYYPDALTWEDAKPIEPKMYDGSDDWHVTVAAIEVQPSFKPLDGDATIKGNINLSGLSARAKVSKAEGDESVSYTVYLKDKSDNAIIAMTETDAEGNYQFDNVPVGNYQVIPNVEGYKLDNNTGEATVTETNEVVNVDCDMKEVEESELFPDDSEGEVLAGDADGNGTVDVNDITLIVKYLLGESVTINMTNADYNQDSKVDVADMIQLINNIVNK